MPNTTTDYTIAAAIALAIMGLVGLGLHKSKALPLERNLLLTALAFKLLAGCAYGYYQMQQTGYLTDAVAFYKGAHGLWGYILAKPGEGLQLLTMPYDYGIMTTWLPCIPFSDDQRPYNLIRGLVLLVPTTGGGYYTMNVILSGVGFWGAWLCYSVLRSAYPMVTPWAFFVFMLEPLTVFFASGLSKEPVILACIGMLLWGMHRLLRDFAFRWRPVLALLLALWVSYGIKPFPIVALFLCAPVMVVLMRGKLVWYSWSARVVLIGIACAGVYLLFFSAFRLEAVFEEIFYLRRRAGEYLSPEALKASSYFTYTDYEPTVAWALSKIPHATFAALFRPLPHETHNTFAMAVSSINVTLLTGCVFLLVRTRWRALACLQSSQLALPVFMLCYSLPYAYFLGISTTFFGSLIRYRVATLPFFLVALVMLYLLSIFPPVVSGNQSVAEK